MEVVAGRTTFLTMAYIVIVNLLTAILHRRYRPTHGWRVRGDVFSHGRGERRTGAIRQLPGRPRPGPGINTIVAFRSSPAPCLGAFTRRKWGVEASEQREARR